MFRFAIALLVFTAIFTAYSSAGSPEELAIKSAESWLKLVDQGAYARSWDEAAPLFKDAVTRDHWIQSLDKVRKPLGTVKSRKVVAARHTSDLPGAPEGEYVVIQFKTDFANQPDSVETVTPMKDKDGTWRVSGYYIK